MGGNLNLWDVSDGHPKAREELERLTHLEKTLEQIANEGCGNTRPSLEDSSRWVTCRDGEICDKGNWCWCCVAREALERDA